MYENVQNEDANANVVRLYHPDGHFDLMEEVQSSKSKRYKLIKQQVHFNTQLFISCLVYHQYNS